MKAKKWLSALMGAILAWGIAAGGIGCLVTGFSVPVEDLSEVLMAAGLCALLTGALLQWKHGGKCLLALLALVLGYVLREGTVLQQIEKLVYEISRVYDKAYHWGVLYWSDTEPAAVAVDDALAALCCAIAMLGTWVNLRQKWSGILLIPGLLPLIACCVVTDTTPGEGWLLLLLVAMVLWLLTATVRQNRSPAEGNRLTAMLLIPVLLAGMLLFYLAPQGEYVVPEMDLLSYLTGMFTPDGSIDVGIGLSQGRVDLTAVGPKFRARYPVMHIVSDHNDKLYLRGQALDVYDGVSWSASEVSTGKDPCWPEGDLVLAGKVTVSLVSRHYYEYFPYYVDLGNAEFVNGSLGDGEGREYAYIRMKPQGQLWGNPAGKDPERFQKIYEQNTQLPEQARQWAEEILAAIIGNGVGVTEAQIVEAVGVFVSASARYDLDTSRMPEGSSDFARWFIEESDSGYCIHFATAATVLLRAAGIPARYVSGYTANVFEGQRVTVTADKAHAWVEYLRDGAWQILDPTPAEQEEPPQTEKPTETETTPPTEDTQETLPTLPDVTTEPTEKTESTQQTQGSTEGTSGNGDAGAEEQQPTWLKKVLTLLLWIGIFCGAAALQYGIRVKIRSRQLRRGHRNQRALHRWRYVKTLSRLTGKVPPEELKELAEKAVFSQHTLTLEELLEFDLWLDETRQVILKKPWPVRLAIRLIWAIE